MASDFNDIPGLIQLKPLEDVPEEVLNELKYNYPNMMKTALRNLDPELSREMRKGEMAAKTAIIEGTNILPIHEDKIDLKKRVYALGWNSVIYKLKAK